MFSSLPGYVISTASGTSRHEWYDIRPWVTPLKGSRSWSSVGTPRVRALASIWPTSERRCFMSSPPNTPMVSGCNIILIRRILQPETIGVLGGLDMKHLRSEVGQILANARTRGVPTELHDLDPFKGVTHGLISYHSCLEVPDAVDITYPGRLENIQRATGDQVGEQRSQLEPLRIFLFNRIALRSIRHHGNRAAHLHASDLVPLSGGRIHGHSRRAVPLHIRTMLARWRREPIHSQVVAGNVEQRSDARGAVVGRGGESQGALSLQQFGDELRQLGVVHHWPV